MEWGKWCLGGTWERKESSVKNGGNGKLSVRQGELGRWWERGGASSPRGTDVLNRKSRKRKRDQIKSRSPNQKLQSKGWEEEKKKGVSVFNPTKLGRSKGKGIEEKELIDQDDPHGGGRNVVKTTKEEKEKKGSITEEESKRFYKRGRMTRKRAKEVARLGINQPLGGKRKFVSKEETPRITL